MEKAGNNRVKRFIGWGGKKTAVAEEEADPAVLAGWGGKRSAALEENHGLSVLLDSVQQVALALQEEYERSLTKVGRDVSQLATQVATLHPIVSRLKSDHAVDDKRNRILEAEQAKLKEEITRSQSELEHYRALSVKLREQIDAASEREATDKNTIKSLKGELEKALGDIQEREGELTYEKRKRSEIEQDRDVIRARLTKIETEYFQAKRQIAKVINDHGVIKSSLAAREMELERAMEDLAIERSARAQAESLLARSRHEIEEAHRENREKEKELQRVVAQYEAEIQDLRAKKTNAENAEMALRSKAILVGRLLANQRAKTDKAYEHIGHLQESIRKLMSEEAAGRAPSAHLDWEAGEEAVSLEDIEEADPENDVLDPAARSQIVRLPVRERNS